GREFRTFVLRRAGRGNRGRLAGVVVDVEVTVGRDAAHHGTDPFGERRARQAVELAPARGFGERGVETIGGFRQDVALGDQRSRGINHFAGIDLRDYGRLGRRSGNRQRRGDRKGDRSETGETGHAVTPWVVGGGIFAIPAYGGRSADASCQKSAPEWEIMHEPRSLD